jgi:hypothetical protein
VPCTLLNSARVGVPAKLTDATDPAMTQIPSSTADHDAHKGAMEEERPHSDAPGAPGLDADGLPNDATAIAQDALGARQDGTQG